MNVKLTTVAAVAENGVIGRNGELPWPSGPREILGGIRKCLTGISDQVYQRGATRGGDAEVPRHDGFPTVEFGFSMQTVLYEHLTNTDK